MKTDMLKLTPDLREAFVSAIEAKGVTDLVASVKAAGDDSGNGRFKVTISTADRDRQGEVVDQNGWDTTLYLKNPIVLWGHDYYSLPIGICDKLYLEGGNLVAEGSFAPEAANPFAQQVRQLYDLGIVRATSVGFIPLEFDTKDSRMITKAELLEFSFVPVPANPYALTMNSIRSNGLNAAMLISKGLVPVEEKTAEEIAAEEAAGDAPEATEEAPVVETTEEAPAIAEIAPEAEQKAAEIGATCTLDDGTEGIFAEDSNNTDGALICVPGNTAKEEKGAVADELAKDETAEAKYKKLDQFFDIVYAFVDVYLDPSVSPDAFDTLLAETITILQNPPAADDEAKSMIAKALKAGTGKSYSWADIKAGRTISAKNRQALEDVVAVLSEVKDGHLSKAITALGDLAKAGETDGGAGDEEAEKSAVAEKGSIDEMPAELAGLNDFAFARAALRRIVSAGDQVLEEFNSRARGPRI